MASLLGTDGLPIRDSGIWAKEKLHYLEHYLNIFFIGMRKKWPGKLYYIDLFLGLGVATYVRPGKKLMGLHLSHFGSTLLNISFSKWIQIATRH